MLCAHASSTCDVAQWGKRTDAPSKLGASQPPLCRLRPVPGWFHPTTTTTTTSFRPIARRELQHITANLQHVPNTPSRIYRHAGTRRDRPLGSRCTQNINTRSPTSIPPPSEQPSVPQCAFFTCCPRPFACLQGCAVRIPPLVCDNRGRDQTHDAREKGRQKGCCEEETGGCQENYEEDSTQGREETGS